MNPDEALEILGPLRNPNMDGWRGRHEDHYDHQQYPGQRFPSGPAGQMNFPPVSNIFSVMFLFQLLLLKALLFL